MPDHDKAPVDPGLQEALRRLAGFCNNAHPSHGDVSAFTLKPYIRVVIDALSTKPAAPPSLVEGVREALDGAVVTVGSRGGRDPAKRSADVTIAFSGEGSLDRARAVHDRLAALAQVEGKTNV